MVTDSLQTLERPIPGLSVRGRVSADGRGRPGTDAATAGPQFAPAVRSSIDHLQWQGSKLAAAGWGPRKGSGTVRRLQAPSGSVFVRTRGTDQYAAGGGQNAGEDWRQETTARVLPTDALTGQWNCDKLEFKERDC